MSNGDYKPRRIALVTQGFFSGGGVPSVARWLRAGLEGTGNYSVDVFDLATSHRDLHSRRILRPITWARGSLRGPDRDGVQQWGANAVELEVMRYRPRAELTRSLRSYDLIQVVGGSPAAARATSNCGVPVVLQTATTVKWERRSLLAARAGVKRGWRGLMTRLTSHVEVEALLGVDAVMVENDDMFAFVKSVGQKNVNKAPPGVDVDRFTPNPEGWRADGYLLSVCRLGDARKGLDRMVRAYHQLRLIHETVPHLVLAGTGKLRRDVAKLIEELELGPYVEVRSDIAANELAAIYRGASVFLQTSHEEGLGISVLEAMAAGLPVVSTETSGTRESVQNGETGWLVSQDNEPDLACRFANTVLQVIQAEGGSMSQCARARVLSEFSLEVTLSRFTNTYESLL